MEKGAPGNSLSSLVTTWTRLRAKAFGVEASRTQVMRVNVTIGKIDLLTNFMPIKNKSANKIEPTFVPPFLF